MAKRRRGSGGHPARAAERRAQQEQRGGHPLDVLVRHAQAHGDPRAIEAAHGMRALLIEAESAGHVSVRVKGGELSIEALDDVGRDLLSRP